MLKIDDMDKAIAGVATVWQGNQQVKVLVYDGLKMIDELIAKSSPQMSADDAMEYIEYNILSAYVGPDTPIVYFGSFQDLLGRDRLGNIKAKNAWLHTVNWDLVIFDEYHFGAWRETAKELFEGEEEAIAKKEAKLEYTAGLEEVLCECRARGELGDVSKIGEEHLGPCAGLLQHAVGGVAQLLERLRETHGGQGRKRDRR